VDRSREGVRTGRLVGGELDRIMVEIEPGQELVEMRPLITFGGPADRAQQLQESVWLYRFAHVEDGPKGLESVFNFVERQDPGP
jgi:hypothetical protein